MITWNDISTRVEHGNLPPARRVERTDAQWAELLSKEQYAITRAQKTERPFSAPDSEHTQGTYHCICCDQELFLAEKKYNSGSGWPSFTQPAADNAVAYIGDHSLGMSRVEAVCAVCDAHLGHVFPDGPAPSGLRYCINGLALKSPGS